MCIVNRFRKMFTTRSKIQIGYEIESQNGCWFEGRKGFFTFLAYVAEKKIYRKKTSQLSSIPNAFYFFFQNHHHVSTVPHRTILILILIWPLMKCYGKRWILHVNMSIRNSNEIDYVNRLNNVRVTLLPQLLMVLAKSIYIWYEQTTTTETRRIYQ